MFSKKNCHALAILLALLQMLLLLVSCNGTGAATTGATAGTTGEITTAPPTGTTSSEPESSRVTTEGETTTEEGTTEAEDPLPEYIYLARNGEALYQLVRSSTVTGETATLIYDFMSNLEILTGATFRVIDDSTVPTSEREILIGAFEHREEARTVAEGIEYTESRVELMGERIVVVPYTGHLRWIFDYFIELLVEIEDGCWAIPAEELFFSRNVYTGGSIPPYRTENGVMMGDNLYFGTRTGYTVGYNGTTRAEFDAYVELLESEGYELYAENEIGKVEFYTYTKDSVTLHVQYITAEKEPAVKISMTRGEFLPPTEPASYTKYKDSSIVSLRRLNETGHGGNSGLWGLNMIFQLADGSFVIVDGSLYTPGHETMLYEYLMANKPEEHERPIISCWLWTHGHGDHVDMCKNMISKYSDRIDVLTFAYNYPDWSVLPERANPGDYFGDGLVADTKRYYPDANQWVMHAGQRLYVADAVIECIWTHEDSYPALAGSVNGTDSVFRITIDGIECMMLGDCEDPHNTKMISHYGEELQSHVVQNSHHTLNGPQAMYEVIDPIISFWANTDDAYYSYTYAHAVYLKNTRWTRTNATGETVSGNREHYTHSYNTTLYIKDLKTRFDGLK